MAFQTRPHGSLAEVRRDMERRQGDLESSRLPANRKDPRELENAWVFFKAADERLVRLQDEFPVIPPMFKLPRASANDYLQLAKGPGRYEHQDLRLAGAHASNSREQERLITPEQHVEDHEVKVCQEEVRKRAYENEGFTRTFGGQLAMLVLFVFYEYFIFNAHTKSRIAPLMTQSVTFLWLTTVIMFGCSWAKGVVHAGRILFRWLECTFDAVQHSGEMTSLEIRRQLLLRVLGGLHVRVAEQDALRARLEPTDYRFEATLDEDQARFKPSEYEADNHVESGCLFLDHAGELQRFIWTPYEDAYSTEVTMETKIRNQAGMARELNDPKLQPWANQSLDFMLDIQGKYATKLVKSNPWWEKLEFQLRSEQHRVKGYRTYLGAPFNTESRFIFWWNFIPTSTIMLIAALHIKFVTDNPEIAVDSFLMIPHLCMVIGFAFSLSMVSVLVNTPRCTRFIVNRCMTVLETQVNAEWAYIFDKVKVEEEANRRFHDFDSLDGENSIPALWQVTASRESVQHIALGFKENFVDAGRGTRSRWSGFNLR